MYRKLVRDVGCVALAVVGISSWASPLALVAQTSSVRIHNGSDETLEYVEVTWSTYPEDYEDATTQPLEPGASVVFEFSREDNGCVYNVTAEGEEGYYTRVLLNFCTLDDVRLTAADFASDDPGSGERGVADVIADALLRLGATGFGELAPHLDAYRDGCADSPTAISNDPIDMEAILCPNGHSVVGQAIGSGAWVYLQELEWIDAEDEDEANEFLEFLAEEVHEALNPSCGPLRTERMDSRVVFRAMNSECAPAGIVLEWVARDSWEGSHLLRLLVLRLDP